MRNRGGPPPAAPAPPGGLALPARPAGGEGEDYAAGVGPVRGQTRRPGAPAKVAGASAGGREAVAGAARAAARGRTQAAAAGTRPLLHAVAGGEAARAGRADRPHGGDAPPEAGARRSGAGAERQR